MKRCGLVVLAMLISSTVFWYPTNANSDKGLEITDPYIRHLKLKSADLKSIFAGSAVAYSLSTDNDKEMAAFVTLLIDAKADAIIEAYRQLTILQNNPDTLAYGKFSSLPTLADLDNLTIDNKDLYSLSKCEVKNADVKLSENEILQLRKAYGTGQRLTPQNKARLTTEYKKILLERVKGYMAKGAGALSTFADKSEPVNGQEVFAGLAREQVAFGKHCTHFNAFLTGSPESQSGDPETFFYWAKQKFGSLKPVITLVQVAIHREGDRYFIACKSLYTSHYTESGLLIAELIPVTTSEGQPRTLIANTLRLQVDMLGGQMSFLARRMARPKMLAKLKESVQGLRLRVEGNQAQQPVITSDSISGLKEQSK
jgi:hypothetical protein